MLSDLLGPDPDANQLRWVRSAHNPVIPCAGTGWAEDFIAPCSLVERDGELWIYAEGSAGGHEQIGLFTADAGLPAGPDGWRAHPANPVLGVGSGFDAGLVPRFSSTTIRCRMTCSCWVTRRNCWSPAIASGGALNDNSR